MWIFYVELMTGNAPYFPTINLNVAISNRFPQVVNLPGLFLRHNRLLWIAFKHRPGCLYHGAVLHYTLESITSLSDGDS